MGGEDRERKYKAEEVVDESSGWVRGESCICWNSEG